MNLTELIKWSVGVILGLTAVYSIDDVHHSILKAQAKLLYESRTATWGSPQFLHLKMNKKMRYGRPVENGRTN